MKRRGLSDVVTTVLIILLVLAAVAILGKYLLGFIQSGGSEISGATACSTLDLKPVACNSTTTGVTFRYERGAGEATVTNVTLILIDASGASTLVARSTPAELESAVYHGTTTSRVVSAALAGEVKTDAGTLYQCERTASVQCT